MVGSSIRFNNGATLGVLKLGSAIWCLVNDKMVNRKNRDGSNPSGVRVYFELAIFYKERFMTAIAFDGKYLVADAMVVADGVNYGNTAKIVQLKDGSWLASAGTLALAPAVAAWLEGGEKPTPAEDEDYMGLLVRPSGEASEISGNMRLFPACAPWAGGSGAVVALTAMRCRKNAIQAVQLACQTVSGCGGPLQLIKIKRRAK